MELAVSNGKHDLESVSRPLYRGFSLYVLRRTETFSMEVYLVEKSHTLKEFSSCLDCRPLCPRSLAPVIVERQNGLQKLLVVATPREIWVMQTSCRKQLMLRIYRNSLRGIPKDGSMLSRA